MSKYCGGDQIQLVKMGLAGHVKVWEDTKSVPNISLRHGSQVEHMDICFNGTVFGCVDLLLPGNCVWRTLLITVVRLRIPWKSVNLLLSLVTVIFLEWVIVLHGIRWRHLHCIACFRTKLSNLLEIALNSFYLGVIVSIHAKNHIGYYLILPFYLKFRSSHMQKSALNQAVYWTFCEWNAHDKTYQ